MQAVILAAGKGTRMQPITLSIPKPMIKVGGVNFIERNIDLLPEKVDEVVIVVGYLKDQIMNHFENSYKGRKIKYVYQEKPLGTADALWACKDLLHGDFLVMMSDDIYCKSDIEKIVNNKNNVISVQKTNKPFSGGVVIKNSHNKLIDIVEGGSQIGGYVNTALYKLNTELFNYPIVQIKGSSEYGLPQTLVASVKDYPLEIVEVEKWRQISDLKDLRDFQASEIEENKIANPLI